jgi:hypothetical protein
MTDSPPLAGEIRPRGPSIETVLRVAMDVLAVRGARWLALLMSFALFGAAVWWPSPWRLYAATGFTVLMAIPVWFRKEK